MRTNHLLSVTILLAVVGCGDDKGTTGQDPTTNTPSNNTNDESSSGGQSETGVPAPTTTEIGGTSGGGSSTGGPPVTSAESSGFIVESDTPNGNIECDVFAQDCPEGQKCMPWANNGGGSWNASKCTPVDAMPGQAGDSCVAEGGGVSGVDNCDKGTMCWFLDAENKGTCIEMCGGTIEAPTCGNADQLCDITNDGVIIICLDTCNPLTQDCPDGQICFSSASGNNFVCDFDASGDEGQYQDPCAYINVCDYGLFCANQASVPDCSNGDGCCTPYCSLAEPECPAGTTCESWYEEGMAPPGQEDIGACVIPV